MPSPDSQNRDVVALPFVGREQELAELETAIASEEGQLILVVGPWQHGKSELLRALHRRNFEALRKSHSRFSLRYDLNRNDDSEAFLRCLRDDLLQIKGLTRRRLVRRVPARPDQIRGLVGAPFALASAIPWLKPLSEAGKDLAASLVPESHRLPREDLLIVLNAVARKLSGDQRLVLIFDPQEYLHESSGPDWVSLCDRLPDRVKVVIAQRPDDNIVSYGPAMTHPRIRRIPCDPLMTLPREPADKLVEYAAHHPRARFAALGSDGLVKLKRICWERWAGHPLLLSLVLPALPLAPADKDEVLNAAVVAPRGFDEVMQQRWHDVLAIAEDAADVLRALAVLAAPTLLDALAGLLNTSTDSVRRAAAHRAVQTLIKPRPPLSTELEILHISCGEFILAPANTDVEQKKALHGRAAQMYADRLKVRPTDPQALVGVLRHLGDSGDHESLRVAVRHHVPEMGRLRLWRPALRAVEQALGPERALSESERAPLLAMAGNLLYNLGERQRARDQQEEALFIYRKLAEAEPGAYLPDLAMTLNNLANLLRNLGERAQALEHYEEALSIRRKLAAAEPGTYLPNVATTLNNLGSLLSDLGERGPARQHFEEALSIRRKLAAAEPGAYLPDVAGTLNNLGSLLSDLGERGPARQHYEEALSIRRKLAAAEPGTYLPNVATTLNNLGNLLSALGERAQARKDYDEALSIRRKLAAAEPGAYLPNVATTLNNLGNLLSALGERAQARKDYEEALSIRRKLAAAEPRAFRERLRAVVNNASIFAQESGISANHWPALREALETLERLDREAQ
jgi:tetratricopeptide (TPR) repeat protein